MTKTIPLRSKHHRLIVWFSAFLWLLVASAVHALPESEPIACQQSSAGEFEMKVPDGSQRPVLLLDTQVLEALAFGPVYLGPNSTRDAGHILIAKHRDSHFALLQDIEL
jgi:hypothetical protein